MLVVLNKKCWNCETKQDGFYVLWMYTIPKGVCVFKLFNRVKKVHESLFILDRQNITCHHWNFIQ